MKISLIITTYNWKEALEAVLKSIKEQTQLPDEVIIADDGSAIDTQELIKHFQQTFPVPLIHSWQEDQGFRAAQSRNKAIARATGDYIIMIDGDIILSRNFIKAHQCNASSGWFVQGGRAKLNEQQTKKLLNKQFIPNVLNKGIKNRKNSIDSNFLSKIFSSESNNAKKTRTCNFAAWKKDIIEINGFDNNFIGWGREDSEFVERLLFSGKNRLYLKFAATCFHLHHNENPRQQLPKNQEILENTITYKKIRTENGIDCYMPKKESNS
jgi:glycosyltransferase involved in cell wall biosynthesis